MKKIWLCVGVVLGVMLVPISANAEVRWSGPGYYVEDNYMTDLGRQAWGYPGDAGPYSSQAACRAVIHAGSDGFGTFHSTEAWCNYYLVNWRTNPHWTERGFYIEQYGEPQAGPFSSISDCKANLSARGYIPPEALKHIRCHYEESDPDSD